MLLSDNSWQMSMSTIQPSPLRMLLPLSKHNGVILCLTPNDKEPVWSRINKKITLPPKNNQPLHSLAISIKICNMYPLGYFEYKNISQTKNQG